MSVSKWLLVLRSREEIWAALYLWFGPNSTWAGFARVVSASASPGSHDGNELMRAFKLGYENCGGLQQVQNVIMRGFFETSSKLYQESILFMCF